MRKKYSAPAKVNIDIDISDHGVWGAIKGDCIYGDVDDAEVMLRYDLPGVYLAELNGCIMDSGFGDVIETLGSCRILERDYDYPDDWSAASTQWV